MEAIEGLGSLFCGFLGPGFSPGLSTKPDFLSEFATHRAILRRHHRITVLGHGPWFAKRLVRAGFQKSFQVLH